MDVRISSNYAEHIMNLPLLDKITSFLVMKDVQNAEFYLLLVAGILTVLAFVQLRVFSRPPPVPLKHLPRRPALSILFKPDEIVATSTSAEEGTAKSSPSRDPTAVSSSEKKVGQTRNTDFVGIPEHDEFGDEDHLEEDSLHSGKSEIISETSTVEAPMLHLHDLPDSFAPLLSSSQTDVVLQQLTADLLHAVQAEASVRVREGRHEIPLNKNHSRPQLQLHSPKGGCKITAIAQIGSDKFTLEEDLDVSRETTSRSKPMVKKAGIVLNPPMPLANVAPTLIHFPTLFEDKHLPYLRRIQIVRMFIDFVVSMSSLLEKLLWIIESFCQVHLSNVAITPTFKGKEQDNSPEWRLTLAFSGHVVLFGFLPIPFISVVLPTFVIPQPHALISYLLSSQPLASAELRRENIEEQRLALAIINTAESWHVDLRIVGTPPALCLDVTLPGGRKYISPFQSLRRVFSLNTVCLNCFFVGLIS